MIRRLALTKHRRRDSRWPDEPTTTARTTTGNLYEARKPFRKLRVLIDAELMEPAPKGSPLTKRQVLADLCEHDLIEALRYADDGPPAHLARGDHGEVPGWVVTTATTALGGDAITVLYSTGESVHTSWAGGDAINLAAADIHAPAYQDMGPEAAAARRHRDGLAQQMAEQGIGADVYVTDRPYLHNPSWDLAPSVTVCGVDEALPIVGLYLRSQGEYLVQHNYRFNRGLYYWVGTGELLPSGWRWFSACVEHSSSVGDHSLTILGGSLLQRVDRALEARDAIHMALNQPQNNDTQDDALSRLDVILLFLMGAVDASARVAHIVFGFPASDLYRAAWQNRRPGGWLTKVREQDAALAAVVDPGTEGGNTLTILRLLRNSVHGAALQDWRSERDSTPSKAWSAYRKPTRLSSCSPWTHSEDVTYGACTRSSPDDSPSTPACSRIIVQSGAPAAQRPHDLYTRRAPTGIGDRGHRGVAHWYPRGHVSPGIGFQPGEALCAPSPQRRRRRPSRPWS